MNALVVLASGSLAGFFHSGTPAGVPVDADCALRLLAFQYGQKLVPQRGSFRSLFDALQLAACGMKAPADDDSWHAPRLEIPEGDRIMYLAADGPLDVDGSKSKSCCCGGVSRLAIAH